MLRNWWAGVAVGVACALGAVVAVSAATDQARAQSGFTVTAGQLQINQKISQASVRRSNRALNHLAPVRTAASDAADDGSGGVKPPAGTGWTADHIADGAVGRGKLAPDVRAALPRWAIKTGNDAGAPARTSSPGIQLIRVGQGFHHVDLGTPLGGCSWSGTLSNDAGSLPAAAILRTSFSNAFPTRVTVFTFATDGVAQVDSSFTLHVFC
jgi:hypothetical protein